MIRYRELRRRYELDGAQKTTEHLSEALKQKHLRPEDFSIRDLAEALIPDGHHWVRALDPHALSDEDFDGLLAASGLAGEGVGLDLPDRMAPVKHAFARRAMGLAGDLPRMLR